jgi:membrane protease YdiL (CAAX protease family)
MLKLPLLSGIFLLCIFLMMPALGVRSYLWIKSGKPVPPKTHRYGTAIGLLVVLFWLAWMVALTEELTLFHSSGVQAEYWEVGLIFTAVLLLRTRTGWARIPQERKNTIRLLLPENPRELAYWVVISLLAGIAEETAYRGVAFQLLCAMTHSPVLAMLLCVIAFAAAHMAQGLKAAVAVGVIGALLHALVIWSGTLYVAMVVHAIYDLLLGVLVMRLFQSAPAPVPPHGSVEAQG